MPNFLAFGNCDTLQFNTHLMCTAVRCFELILEPQTRITVFIVYIHENIFIRLTTTKRLTNQLTKSIEQPLLRCCFSASQNTCHILFNPKLITMFKTARYLTLSSARSIPSNFLKTRFNIMPVFQAVTVTLVSPPEP